MDKAQAIQVDKYQASIATTSDAETEFGVEQDENDPGVLTQLSQHQKVRAAHIELMKTKHKRCIFNICVFKLYLLLTFFEG